MDGGSTAPSPEAERTPESTSDPLLDTILRYWEQIALSAWEGAITAGPGFVVVSFSGESASVEYRVGSPCSCHPVTQSAYDSKTQVFVVVRDGDESTVPILITGWPTPEDAQALVLAETMGATVQ